MKKIISLIVFMMLWLSFYSNTYANSYPLNIWRLKDCFAKETINTPIFPCANNIYTYGIFYWMYNPKWLNWNIELGPIYNHTDLFWYDNPVLAANLVVAMWFEANWVSVMNEKFLNNYAWFNYQFIKKLLAKIRVMPKQQRIQYLTILNKKLTKIYNIISIRLNKYLYKRRYEKLANKYELYNQIVWWLKLSIEGLLYYDKHNMVNKYLKDTKWRNRIKNWGKPYWPIEQREDEDRRDAEARKKQRLWLSISELENKFNCHWYELPKNVYDVTKQEDKKIVWLSICIMEKKWLPNNIWNMFLNNFKYYFNHYIDGWTEGGETIANLMTHNWTYSKVVLGKIVYLTKAFDKDKIEGRVNIIIHELSHNINYLTLKDGKVKNLNKFISSAWDFKWNDNFQHTKTFLSRYVYDNNYKIKNPSCMIRDYWKTNQLEDFATYWEYYFFERFIHPKYKHSSCILQRQAYFKAILNDIK